MDVVSLDRFQSQPISEISGSGCDPLEPPFQPTPMAARMTHRRFWSAVMATALALLPAPVWAVVNAGGNSNTVPPADDPGFYNVGSTGGASIIYLGNRWALTASHVFINPGTPLFYSSQAQVYLPYQVANAVTSSVFGSADLKLIDLATDPGLPSLTIGTSQPTGGPVVMVGNGRPQSDPNQPIQEYWNVSTPASGTSWSWTSISAPKPPVTPIPASYWTSNSDPPIPQGTYQASTITYDGGQAIRWGQNQVTGTMTVTDQNGHSTAGYYTTFNDPTYAPGPTALGGNEAQASVGDSGGAVFYKNGSSWTLTGAMIGVYTFSSHPDSANPANSSMAVFGELTAVADLTNYRSAILNVITPLPWTGQTGGTGVANSSWDTTSTNWLNALNGSKVYYDASSPIFGDTNPANNNSPITNGNVVVQANGVFPASVSFNNSSVAYSFNDAGTSTMGIGGATGITKIGTGLVTLLGANTFIGPVQISAGRINVQNNGAGRFVRRDRQLRRGVGTPKQCFSRNQLAVADHDGPIDNQRHRLGGKSGRRTRQRQRQQRVYRRDHNRQWRSHNQFRCGEWLAHPLRRHLHRGQSTNAVRTGQHLGQRQYFGGRLGQQDGLRYRVPLRHQQLLGRDHGHGGNSAHQHAGRPRQSNHRQRRRWR